MAPDEPTGPAALLRGPLVASRIDMRAMPSEAPLREGDDGITGVCDRAVRRSAQEHAHRFLATRHLTLIHGNTCRTITVRSVAPGTFASQFYLSHLLGQISRHWP